MNSTRPSARASQLLIRTPEGIVFSLPLGGPVARMLACAIDLAVVALLNRLIQAVLALFALLSDDLASAFAFVAFFIVQIGYAIGFEWFWRGQTLGKKLLRLRVMDAQGLRLQFSQIMLRNLLRVVDILPGFYLVGGLACVLSRRAQRLGDFAANTVVIRVLPARAPDFDKLAAGKYNSLRAHAHLAARLRQRISPPEAALALRALLRRETLEPAARLELFDDIADHFRAAVEFPPEAIAGLSSEQYVLNVVDVLYRPRAAPKLAAPESIPR